MRGYDVNSPDGPVGKVRDFYFDDQTWRIKYIVVRTSKLAEEKDVLILPQSLATTGQWTSSLLLNISRDEVGKSPDIDTDMPVSRQHEMAVRSHFGADVYYSWGGGFMGSHNLDLSGYEFPEITRNKNGTEFDPHLFSVRSVTGLRADAADGRCGHVRDFVIDANESVIRFLVVETGSIFAAKKVIISPLVNARMNPDGSSVEINLPRMKVFESPEYDRSDLDSEPFDQRVARHSH